MSESNSSSSYRHIIPDVEEGKAFKNATLNDKNIAEVQSILRSVENSRSRNEKTTETIIKILITIIIVIICSPIIICDLYFGLNDNSCVEEYPPSLSINLKTYMIVSALVGISGLTLLITSSCFISSDNSDAYNSCIIAVISLFSLIFSVFHLIWNILGGVVFWSFAYKNNLCDKNVSTYLFISLILKYITSCYAFKNNMKSDKKR